MYSANLFIGGEEIKNTEARFEILNPATEDVLGTSPVAGPAQVEEAVQAAQKAFGQWRVLSAFERSNRLRQVARLLRERVEQIAPIITQEVGKPLAEARGETIAAAEYFDWCAEEGRRITGTMRGGRVPESRYEITHEPVGVVLALTAWNFPIILPARKLAAALAAGCTVILRPAEEAPGSAAALVQCCHDAGLPAGTVNLLLGSPEVIVSPLMANPVVRKVSFTGSTKVGQLLLQQSVQTVKRMTMELGGHAPFIVLEDAHIEKTVAAAVLAKFRNAGQVCTAPSRFLVHASLAEEFTEKMAVSARTLKIGNGLDDGTQMGPLTTLRQRERAERMVSDARNNGATVICGGGRPQEFNRGYFFEPTVLTNLSKDSRILCEEPFSPVAAIVPFSDVDDAIAQANALEFGLAAYVFSRSGSAIENVASRLEAGVVGVNTVAVAAPEAPFGGIKQSGWGREGGEGLDDFLNAKFVHLVRV
jgi:succinate-semialdehyde dehydrogenase/glutarate-semialdehyde dehydrogenase